MWSSRVWWARLRGSWVWVLPLLAVAWYVATFVLHAWGLVRFPFQAEYGEGPLLNEALRLASGHTIYHNNASPPYIVSNYPPVYVGLLALFHLLGAQGFWAGRALSGASVLAAGVLAGLTVREVLGGGEPAVGAGGRWLSAALALGLICAQYFIWQWGPMERVDSLALAWSMAGLYAVARRPERAERAWPWFLLAALTRQSEIEGLVAALWFLWPRDRARAKGLAARFAGALLVVVAALEVATRGQFLVQILLDNVNRWTVGLAASDLAAWVFIAGGLPLVLFAVWGWRLARPRPVGRLLTGYAAAAWVIVLTVGKIGSSINYFFPSIAAAAMLAALVPHAPGRRQAAAVLLCAFLIGVPPLSNVPGPVGDMARELTAFHDMQTPRFNGLGWRVPLDGADPGDAALVKLLARTPGPILFSDMGDLLQSGHTVFYQAFVMTQVAANGHWNPAPLLADARAEAFPLVIFSFPLSQPSLWDTQRWPPALLRVLATHYHLAGRIGRRWLYRPGSAGSTSG